MTVSTTINSSGVISTDTASDGSVTISQQMILNAQTVTPAGANQNAATGLDGSRVVYLLGAGAANTGVRLPASPTAGQIVFILNTTVNDKRVYPASGGIIGAAAADAAITLASMVAGTSRGGCLLICSDATAGATKWHHFAVA